MKTIDISILDKIKQYNDIVSEIEQTVLSLQENGKQGYFNEFLRESKKGDMQKHCFSMDKDSHVGKQKVINIKWQFSRTSVKTIPYLSLDFLNGKTKETPDFYGDKLTTRYFYEEDVFFESSKNIAQKYDIILFVDGSAGECFTNFHGVVSTTAYKFVLCEDYEHYNSFFVCLFLLKMKEKTNFFEQKRQNTGIPHINIKNFVSQKVIYPNYLDMSYKYYLDDLLSDYILLKNEIQTFFKLNQCLSEINRTNC